MANSLERRIESFHDKTKHHSLTERKFEGLGQRLIEEEIISKGQETTRGKEEKGREKEFGKFEDIVDKILKGDDQEAILNFLQSKIPNLDDIVEEEIAKVKQEGVDFMKSVEK